MANLPLALCGNSQRPYDIILIISHGRTYEDLGSLTTLTNTMVSVPWKATYERTSVEKTHHSLPHNVYGA